MVLLAAVLFSTTGPALRMIEPYGISRLFLAWMRASIPALLIVGHAAIKTPQILRFSLREFPKLLFYGFFCIAALYYAVNEALTRLPIGLAILLFYTTPLWVIVGTRLLKLEQLTGLRVLALSLGSAGLFLAVGVGGGGHLDPLGVFSALSAGFLNALFMLAGRYGMGRFEPKRMFVHMYLWGAVLLGILAYFTGDAKQIFTTPLPVWGWILYLALFTSLSGNLLLMKSLQVVPSAPVSILCMFEIAAGMFWAWLLYDQVPSLSALFGGCLLVAAVTLVTFEGELQKIKVKK